MSTGPSPTRSLRCRGAGSRTCWRPPSTQADPQGADQLSAMKAAERYVSTGRSTEYGLKTLIARANAGDVIWFSAMVGRIADILAAQGDPDTVDVRRSKAIGILAQPAVALDLLARHQADPDPHPQTEPAAGRRPEAGDRPGQPSRSRGPEEAPNREPHVGPVRPGRPARSRLDEAKLRPPVTLYLHLAAEALLAGHGVVGMEDVGPGPARPAPRTPRRPGPDPAATSHRPHRHHPRRRLPHPPADAGTRRSPQPHRHLPLGHHPRPRLRPRPHHPLPHAPAAAGRPARPTSATSAPSTGATTGPKRWPAGGSDNPNPASTSGAHPTAGSTASTTTAPTPTATPPTPTLSGT